MTTAEKIEIDFTFINYLNQYKSEGIVFRIYEQVTKFPIRANDAVFYSSYDVVKEVDHKMIEKFYDRHYFGNRSLYKEVDFIDKQIDLLQNLNVNNGLRDEFEYQYAPLLKYYKDRREVFSNVSKSPLKNCDAFLATLKLLQSKVKKDNYIINNVLIDFVKNRLSSDFALIEIDAIQEIKDLLRVPNNGRETLIGDIFRSCNEINIEFGNIKCNIEILKAADRLPDEKINKYHKQLNSLEYDFFWSFGEITDSFYNFFKDFRTISGKDFINDGPNNEVKNGHIKRGKIKGEKPESDGNEDDNKELTLDDIIKNNCQAQVLENLTILNKLELIKNDDGIYTWHGSLKTLVAMTEIWKEKRFLINDYLAHNEQRKICKAICNRFSNVNFASAYGEFKNCKIFSDNGLQLKNDKLVKEINELKYKIAKETTITTT